MESSSVTVAADLSAKIIILCSKYFVNVAHARAEIECLKEQLKNLETTLRHANHLLVHPNSLFLSASRELDDPLRKCQAELVRLQEKLEPNATRKTMRRFGFRAAKWPFDKSGIETVIASLVDYREAITAILQIDQTKLLLDINQRIENLSLQAAENRLADPKPHFNIPFPRDLDFVDRPALREWLEEQYNASPARRIALVGMGGFGKSQIAIEFAYRVHIASPETSVFWIHGGTEAKFEESYRSLANTLTLPDRHDPNTNVLALVRDWLQSAESPPWLIILDNADEMETLFPPRSQDGESQREPLASYLPKTGNGKIVITSRNRSVAERLTGGGHKSIQEVPTMDHAEALKILENKLSQDIDQDGAADLARALDFIPLAVSQAAAYINRRAPRVSISSYMEEFRQNEKQKRSLLNRDAGDLRRREDVSNSVVITWQVTFEQIRHERPSAANLLLLMSFFQSQNIPECMLSGYNNIVESNVEEDMDGDEDLEDDLDILRGYSLLRLSTSSGLCDMHALVQFCTKVWLLESNGNMFARLKSLFLSLCAEYFPSGDFETWASCQVLLPHVKSFLDEEEPTEEPGISNWFELLRNISHYMSNIGSFSAAESTAQKALDSSRRLLGNEHHRTLDFMFLLSSVHLEQDRYEEAELLRVQMIEMSKRAIGDEHPLTLKRLSLLPTLYQLQGKYADAESLLLQMIEISKRIWGDGHPETMRHISDLAWTYSNQGKLAEAELLGVQATETLKRTLGEQHTLTLDGLSLLANTYQKQGRLTEAESLVTQDIEIKKKALGDEHPDVVNAMLDLADIFRLQGRSRDAELLLVQIAETRRKTLGSEHPETLEAIVHLACDLEHQGRFDEALELLRDAVSRLQRIASPGCEESVYGFSFLKLWEQRHAQSILTEECLEDC
ncbi:hypothetical protein ACQKWADRAFT_294513 [Trichoderma austrokoningii]